MSARSETPPPRPDTKALQKRPVQCALQPPIRPQHLCGLPLPSRAQGQGGPAMVNCQNNGRLGLCDCALGGESTLRLLLQFQRNAFVGMRTGFRRQMPCGANCRTNG